MMCERIRAGMEEVATTEQAAGRGNVVTHSVRMGWMLLSAMLAVVVGFATLNMILADSGMAVLNEHSALFTAFVARLTKQG
jgi:hypothetical protein